MNVKIEKAIEELRRLAAAIEVDDEIYSIRVDVAIRRAGKISEVSVSNTVTLDKETD